MKRCDYCGKENTENLTICVGCGTPLEEASEHDASTLPSVRVIAVTTGLAILLCATALFFGLGRLLGELVGAGLPKNQVSMYSFFTSTKPAPIIALALVPFIFGMCGAGIPKQRHAKLTAFLTSSAALVLAVFPLFVPAGVDLWCLPAVLIALQGGASVALYLGAAFQFGAGVWLLCWFRPRALQTGPVTA